MIKFALAVECLCLPANKHPRNKNSSIGLYF